MPLLPRSTVAIGFVTGMLSGLHRRGIDPAPVLAESGISAELLRRSDARVPLPAYATLYNAVVRSLDDEGFALFSGKVHRGMFEFLCRSVIGSRDLAEALARVAAFLRLVLPDIAVGLERDERSAALEIREIIPIGSGRGDPRRIFALEWLLRLIHGLSCWLVGHSVPLDSVQFPYDRPPHAADYALIYTEHPSFGGDRLVARLAASMLTQPIRQDQESLARFLDGAPGKIVVLYRRDHEVVRQVRDLLAADLTGAPSLAQLAQRLEVPLRTLQRRLRQEGSSFRAIKAGLRRNAAIVLLQHRDRPISEVAQTLGYAESSAFYRAFVHWTGEAPTHYRRKNQAAT